MIVLFLTSMLNTFWSSRVRQNAGSNCLPQWRGETRAGTARREKCGPLERGRKFEHCAACLSAAEARWLFLLTFFFFFYTIQFRLSALLRQAGRTWALPRWCNGRVLTSWGISPRSDYRRISSRDIWFPVHGNDLQIRMSRRSRWFGWGFWRGWLVILVRTGRCFCYDFRAETCSHETDRCEFLVLHKSISGGNKFILFWCGRVSWWWKRNMRSFIFESFFNSWRPSTPYRRSLYNTRIKNLFTALVGYRLSYKGVDISSGEYLPVVFFAGRPNFSGPLILPIIDFETPYTAHCTTLYLY